MVKVAAKLHAWIAPLQLREFGDAKRVMVPFAQIAVLINTAKIGMNFACIVGGLLHLMEGEKKLLRQQLEEFIRCERRDNWGHGLFRQFI